MNKIRNATLSLVGQRFGKGVVVKQVERPNHIKRRARFWLMQCDCGSTSIVDGTTLKRQRWKSCGCINKQNLTGMKFGIGTVVRLLGTKIIHKKQNRVWEMKCECGKIYQSSTNTLFTRNTKSCGCLNQRKGKNHPHYKGYENLTGDYWGKLKKGAKNRNILFKISIKEAWELFVKQNQKCALTGWHIKLNKGKQTASLDRIDSSKGYTKENIQWLHKDINRMKQNYAECYFIRACKAITERSSH